MAYLTKQEIFDKVATHLLAQEKVSADERSCTYYGSDGTKCAIGCLIKDEAYNAEIEGCSLMGMDGEKDPKDWEEGMILLFNVLTASGINIKDPAVLSLCTRLQHIHDRGHPGALNFKIHDLLHFWTNELKIAARDHKLKDTVLTNPQG